jgi:hypothetical protein
MKNMYSRTLQARLMALVQIQMAAQSQNAQESTAIDLAKLVVELVEAQAMVTLILLPLVVPQEILQLERLRRSVR